MLLIVLVSLNIITVANNINSIIIRMTKCKRKVNSGDECAITAPATRRKIVLPSERIALKIPAYVSEVSKTCKQYNGIISVKDASITVVENVQAIRYIDKYILLCCVFFNEKCGIDKFSVNLGCIFNKQKIIWTCIFIFLTTYLSLQLNATRDISTSFLALPGFCSFCSGQQRRPSSSRLASSRWKKPFLPIS